MPGLAPSSFRAHRAAVYTGSSASPASGALAALPAYGCWLVTAIAWVGNSNVAIQRSYVVTWYGLDDAGSGENWVRSSQPIGVAKASAGSTPNTFTDLTLSDPTTAGVLTATATWTGGDSRNVRVMIRAMQFAASLDFIQ